MQLETETMTNPNSKDALRALANKLQLQRDALAKDLFSKGPGTERTKQARLETYLRLIEKGFPHDGARDAANQLIHVG